MRRACHPTPHESGTIHIGVVIVAAIAIAIGVALRILLFAEDAPRHAIRVSGNIEVTDAEVGFRIGGVVARRVVSEGEAVRKGDVLAELDATDLTNERALRQAELRAAEAVLAALESGTRPEVIAQAAAALDLARAEAARARSEHLRTKALHDRDVASDQQLESARAADEVARARVQEASERLALAHKGPRDEEIDEGRARAAMAREALALAQTRLGYATLRAPFTGLILSDHLESGEYAAPGMPVVVLGALENVWLRAYVDETDLGRVRLGQTACITTDTFPEEVYTGRLSFLSSHAEFTPKSVQTQKERVKLVYRVKIDVANPDLELKPGMPADADILLATEARGCTPSDRKD
jgi:HlyD family secretion protein